MADMIFSCPACNNYLVVDENGVDKTIKCPFCKTTVQVPRPHLRTGCPACGNLLRAPDYMRKKTIDCPKCNQSFMVFQNIVCISCDKNLPSDAVFCVTCGIDQRSGVKPSVNVPSEKKTKFHNQAQSAKQLLSKSARSVDDKSALPPKRFPILAFTIVLICLVGGFIYLAANYAKKVTRQEIVVNRFPPEVQRPQIIVANKVPVSKENTVVKYVLKTLVALKSNPSDPVALKDLSWCVENVYEAGNGRNVLAGLKTIYALKQLKAVNESNGLTECENICKFYADTPFAGIINPAKFQVSCAKCEAGKVDLPCKQCGGGGVCPSCKKK